MGLIDSHAHLTFPELCDHVRPILDRCAEVDVEAVVTVGTNLPDSRAAVELAQRYAGQVSAAAAFHPHEVGKAMDGDLAAMAELWNDPKVVGLGEMGLDYHYDFADRALQQSVFARQLELAALHTKPLVIHSREALDDTIRLLCEHGFPGRPVVFHCFTGTAEEASRIAGYGWRISFTGIVTFRNSIELRDIAKAYPADMLMLESDSPYLSPEPVRAKRPNEPSYIVHTARFLARLRGETFAELEAQTSRNTREFFVLDR